MRILPQATRLANAFTIVELLVVISIIAVLSTLLLPVLTQSREMAWTAVCMSNQRQMGVLLNTYLTDNRFYFPTMVTSSTVPITNTQYTMYGQGSVTDQNNVTVTDYSHRMWIQLLKVNYLPTMPLLTNPQFTAPTTRSIAICPSVTNGIFTFRPDASLMPTWPYHDVRDGGYSSYASNKYWAGNLVHAPGTQYPSHVERSTDITRENFPLLTDYGRGNPNQGSYRYSLAHAFGMATFYRSADRLYCSPGFWHNSGGGPYNGSTNILTLNGSVTQFRANSVTNWSPNWDSGVAYFSNWKSDATP